MQTNTITNSTGYNQTITASSIQNTNALTVLGEEVAGNIVQLSGNRLIMDIGEDKFLDLTLKQDVPEGIKKGDAVTVSADEISRYKFIPKVSSNNGELNLKELDVNQQILFNFQLPFDKKHADALSLLKENSLPVSKEAIVKLVGLQNKLDYIFDNLTPGMLDELVSTDDIDNNTVDAIFNKMKQLVDTLPLTSEELQNIDIDSLCKEFKDMNIYASKLKEIITSAINNNMPPSRNNVNKINSILNSVEAISDLNGRTIGYVVKNNIEMTINNLLKAKLSFDNLRNIVPSTGSSQYASSGNSGAAAYDSQTSFTGEGSISYDHLNDDIVKILELEKLPVSDKNVNASKILIENNIDVTKENITKVTNLLDNIKELSVDMNSDSVCKLLKNKVDIPNTEIGKLVESFRALSASKGGALIPDQITQVQTTSAEPLTLEQKAQLENLDKALLLLSNTDYDQLSFLLKNEVPVDLKNMLYSRFLLAAQDNTRLERLPDDLQNQILQEFENLDNIDALKSPEKLQELAEKIFNIDLDKSSAFEKNDLRFPLQLSPAGERNRLEDCKAALKELVIPETDENLKAAAALMKNEIPVTHENMKRIIDLKTTAISLASDSHNSAEQILRNISNSSLSNQNIDNIDINSLKAMSEKSIDNLKQKTDNYDEQSIGRNQSLPRTPNLDSKKYETNIKDILSSLGVEVNKINLKAAKVLISGGIDLTPEGIKDCAKTLSILDGMTSMKGKDIAGIIKNVLNDESLTLSDLFKLSPEELAATVDKADPYKGKLTGDEASTRDSFMKALSTVKSMDYKSLGFIMKNGITASLSNLLYAKGIFSAKQSVDLDKLPSIEEFKEKGLFTLTLTPESDFNSRQLAFPRELSSAAESTLSDNIKPALLKMGLPVTDENIDIAKALVQNTLNVNRNSILHVQEIKMALKDLINNASYMSKLPGNWETMDIRTLSSEMESAIQNNPEIRQKRDFKNILSNMISEIKDVDNDTISFMVKNNVPLTLKNIYAAKQFTENKFMLGKQLGELQSQAKLSGDHAIESKVNELVSSFIHKTANLKQLKEHTGEIYQDIHDAIKDIQTQLSQNSVKNSPALAKLAYDIDSNIEFQSKFNTSNTLIQIPMVMNNQVTNLQVYVMNQSESGKKKKLDMDNMDVFLHLNTYNLGTVDTFINLKKSSISLRFGVETLEAADFMEKGSAELEEVIARLGYNNVNISFFTRDTDINILNARDEMIKEIDKSSSGSEASSKSSSDKLNFDIKA